MINKTLSRIFKILMGSVEDYARHQTMGKREKEDLDALSKWVKSARL
jgi:hypothetical protein